MTTMTRGWIVLPFMLSAACGGGAREARAPADTTRVAAPSPVTVQAESIPQLRVDSVRPLDTEPSIPLPATQDTGYTAWRAVEMPSEPWTQSAADPRALLTRVRDVVAAQMEEPEAGVLPTRMLSQAADSAVGLMVHPNVADDSVRDVEFRLHMRREGGGWTVAAVERRERCRRGVSVGGLCV